MSNADETYPIKDVSRLCFLKNIVKNPRIIVGDYTYYDDPDDVHHFERNVLYHFDFIGDKLIIGRFCQLATGIKFIMNGANHAMHGFSTYPFSVFGGPWSEVPLEPEYKGDTVLGHDVWVGNNVTFMPGVEVGSGAVIASGAVVTKNVKPYTIVGGNPARLIRPRFDDDVIQKLLRLAWWDWPYEKITSHAHAIASGDMKLLCSI